MSLDRATAAFAQGFPRPDRVDGQSYRQQMALCMSSRYPWGGPRCTLKPKHDGDHVAEGRINHKTGKAPVIATWPDQLHEPPAPEVPQPRRVKWKRVGPGRYIGRLDGKERYGMAKQPAGRWVVATKPDGAHVGSAATVDSAKDVAERHLSSV